MLTDANVYVRICRKYKTHSTCITCKVAKKTLISASTSHFIPIEGNRQYVRQTLDTKSRQTVDIIG